MPDIGVINIFDQARQGGLVQLRLPKNVANSRLGQAVAMCGDLLAATHFSQEGDLGQVSIFQRDSTGWRIQQCIELPESQVPRSLAMNGDYLAVGMGGKSAASGKKEVVLLFQLQAGHWSLVQSLYAKDQQVADGFGGALSLGGGNLVVGASGANPQGPNSGAAYVFQPKNGRWFQTQKLTASDGSFEARFGHRVEAVGNSLAISAIGHQAFGNKSGAVYLFNLEENVWVQEQSPLFASDASAGSYFGSSLAMRDNHLLVGANEESTRAPEAGAAYLFHFDGAQWRQGQKLVPPHDGYKQKFGTSVAMTEDRIVIAATGENYHAGALYVFETNETALQKN